MKSKVVKLHLLIFASLVVLSFAFFSFAQENADSNKNIFLDSDQDGLSDEEEKAYGTDPRVADTDHDGYSDGAEIKGGYNPLIPAPGDRIMENNDAALAPSDSETNKNLTKEVAQKISDLTKDPEKKNITMEDIQGLVDESLNTSLSEEDLPEITLDDIKIKKQNYSKLPKETADAKRKEDFSKYIAAVYYVLSSNSPKPVTSFDDVSSIVKSISADIISAVSSGSAKKVEKISQDAEKTFDQLKDIEVPEELADTHIKALRFIKYSVSMKDYVNINYEDPLTYMTNLAKMNALVVALMDFYDDIETAMIKYGLQYDALKSDLQSLGVPDLESTESDAKTDSPDGNSNETQSNASASQ